MERTVAEYIQICEWDKAKFLIFSDNVFGALVYYSHLLPLSVSLLLALFIFFKNPRLPATRWLLVTSVLLAIWLFSDLVLWASEKPSMIMFFWSLLVLIEPMIFAGTLFFLYAFIDGRDVSFRAKLIIFTLLLPTTILSSTHFALTNYDLTNCWREAIEGPLAFYGYAVEVIISVWILVLGMERYRSFKDRAEKNKVALITVAAVFFLLSFAMGNIVGSLLADWQIGQYGLFGIPVFMAMLSYLIVRYQAFNVKLIATQLLVVALGISIFSILFVRDMETVQMIVWVTFVLFIILGNLLVLSVKREVMLREKLQEANEGQANLLHIINHQIKGYMTKARLVFDDLLNDKSYGLTVKNRPMIEQGFDSVTEGVMFVQDFLNASNIDKGTYTYNMMPLEFDEIVKNEIEGQIENAERKGLACEVDIKSGVYRMIGDKAQLIQAVRNLIDNSIKYTPSGSIKISLERVVGGIDFKVVDTGVGLSDELKPKLFTKGGRDKDSQKININSTGFGLAFVKGVIEAHQGKVWAESKGAGKGSSFHVALPVA